MIPTLNLLPWREALRERQRRRFQALLLAALIVGGLLGAGVAYLYQLRLDVQQQRNALLTMRLEELAAVAEEGQRYRQRAEAALSRQAQFATWEHQRRQTLALFNALVESLEEGVVYQRLERRGENVDAVALAEHEGRISAQLGRLGRHSVFEAPRFAGVERSNDAHERAFHFAVTQRTPTVSVPNANPGGEGP